MNEIVWEYKEMEALMILQEEAGELTQAISKCFRFGMDQIKPGQSQSNREHLEEELGDLLAMLNLLYDFDIVNMKNVEVAHANKIHKLKQWSNVFAEEV